VKNHFIIVGAQRSGTTYLYNILDEHPEICMAKPVKPEPKYFIDKEINDLDYNEYISLFFNNCNNTAKIYGEKSTSYYERKESANQISKLIPDAKIIFLLRDPVERAISNYYFSFNNGLENRTLEDVFIKRKVISQENIKWISVNPFNYFERGEYFKFIKLYKNNFKSKQLKIIVFEEFRNNKNKIQNLYSFLGVDNKYVPSAINKIINPSVKENQISIEVLEKLKAYYKLPIEELEQMINIDLSIWK